MTVVIVSRAPAETPVPWWWYPGAQLFAEEPAPPRPRAADLLEAHGYHEEALLLRDAAAAVLAERDEIAGLAERLGWPDVAAAVRARPAPGQAR